jgi:hypothetical protein
MHDLILYETAPKPLEWRHKMHTSLSSLLLQPRHNSSCKVVVRALSKESLLR